MASSLSPLITELLGVHAAVARIDRECTEYLAAIPDAQTRAEVTDAAMSERAECVMLNKGPFICEAVRTLDNILRRMQAHQAKKSAMLRPLQVASHVLSELSGSHAADSS